MKRLLILLICSIPLAGKAQEKEEFQRWKFGIHATPTMVTSFESMTGFSLAGGAKALVMFSPRWGLRTGAGLYKTDLTRVEEYKKGVFISSKDETFTQVKSAITYLDIPLWPTFYPRKKHDGPWQMYINCGFTFSLALKEHGTRTVTYLDTDRTETTPITENGFYNFQWFTSGGLGMERFFYKRLHFYMELNFASGSSPKDYHHNITGGLSVGLGF